MDRERLHLRFLLEPYIIDISIFLSLYLYSRHQRENSLCSSKINRKIPFWIFILKEYYQQFWNIISFLWNLFCAKRTNPSIYNCKKSTVKIWKIFSWWWPTVNTHSHPSGSIYFLIDNFVYSNYLCKKNIFKCTWSSIKTC